MNDDIAHVTETGEHLVDNGLSPDASTTREQTESLGRQLQRIEERARTREEDLENVLNKLHAFQQQHTDVISDIGHVSLIILNKLFLY